MATAVVTSDAVVDAGSVTVSDLDVSDRATRDVGKIDIAGIDAVGAIAGQKAMVASIPVTIASDQNDVPITLDSEVVVLGASTASIGKLAANDGVNIGDVDIVSAGTTIAQTPAITAGAYSIGDAVGGLLTFANAARESGGGGVIKDVVIVDDAGQDAELELWLFNQTFTAMADNAAWAPSEADLENLVTVISTEDSAQGWLAAGTPSAIEIEVARRYDLAGTSLFGQLVTRGTPTFAATDDVTVKVALLQD